MKELTFYKYHGTGNDFILIDNRTEFFPRNDTALVASLCNRHFGIGADGLMLLQNKAGYDFEMVYYNSDGKEATMCGNGGRCICAFAQKLGIIRNRTRFIANDGEHEAEISIINSKLSTVKLKMNNVGEIKPIAEGFYANTGSPHYVLFGIPDDVEKKGKYYRHHSLFAPEGVNVNFCKVENDRLFVRTYERGVEAETLSCGTGAVASALTSVFFNKIADTGKVQLSMPGGELSVYYNKAHNSFTDIYLEGPACFVFQGIMEINL